MIKLKKEVKNLTKLKKMVEYLDKLCYYLINSKGLDNEVIAMPEGIIKGIYNEASNYEDGSKKEKEIGLLDGLYYYYKFKKIAKKVDWSIYIEKNKNICNGAPVIKGTRIRPETIYYYFWKSCHNGESSERIGIKLKENYPSLNERTILMSLLYVIKKKGIRAFL